MTSFWSAWVIILTVVTFVLCAVILIWCLKDNMGVEDGEDMGHEFDGIRELNNPLPKWWSFLFIGTFIFAVVYLALYPGLGSFQGLLGWSSSNQTVKNVAESRQHIADTPKHKVLDEYARSLDEANAIYSETFNKLVYGANGELRSIPDIAANPEAMKVGQRLFLQNCALCHGSGGRGNIGFPNLTDKAWLYGGEPEAILTSIMDGRKGEMPPWGAALGEQGVKEVVSYTLSLSGRKVNAKEAAAGKQRFIVCSACHGTDGKGNPAFGAPDMTDQTWLYGDSRAEVTDVVVNGRQGVMPAWKEILGKEKVQLVASYVWSLSNQEQ